MAITITTSPSLLNASGHPIIFEATSNRDSADAVSVTSVSSGTGAFARYAVASHTYLVGDIITGSGFTGINTAYNVRQTVTVISGTYFETDLAFVATATGAGTMTRSNDNFQLKCETIVFDQTKVNIVTIGNNGGFAQVTTSANHNLEIGSLLLIQSNGTYDAIHVVTSKTATTFITSTAYTSATGAVGAVRGGRIVGTKRLLSILISSVVSYRLNCAGHLHSVLAKYLVDSQPTNIDTTINDSIKYFGIRFTEEFDDVDGILKEGDTKLSTGANTATRAILDRSEGININTYYVINPPTSTAFLTNAPLIKKIRPGEEEQLSFLYSGATQLRAGITKYNLAGVAQTEVYTALKTIVDNRGVLPINSNHFDNTISKFDVWLVDSVPNGYSEVRTFIVDKKNYQNPVRVYFENNKGGFDAYTFTGKYTTSANIERTSFEKSHELVYSVSDRGETQIATMSDTIYEVYSELLTKAEALWLKQLLGSTNVYIKNIGDSYFTPIVVLSDSALLYDSGQPSQIKLTYKLSSENATLIN